MLPSCRPKVKLDAFCVDARIFHQRLGSTHAVRPLKIRSMRGVGLETADVSVVFRLHATDLQSASTLTGE